MISKQYPYEVYVFRNRVNLIQEKIKRNKTFAVLRFCKLDLKVFRNL